MSQRNRNKRPRHPSNTTQSWTSKSTGGKFSSSKVSWHGSKTKAASCFTLNGARRAVYFSYLHNTRCLASSWPNYWRIFCNFSKINGWSTTSTGANRRKQWSNE